MEPDLVIMDLAMPVMDGSESFQKLRQEPQTADVPVLALSAHVTGTAVDEAAFGGFTEVLTKPVLPADMLKAVKRHIGEP